MDLRLVHYYPRALVGDGGCTYAVRGWAASVAKAGVKVLVAYDQSGTSAQDPEVDWKQLSPQRIQLRASRSFKSILDDADYLVLHSGWVFHNVQAAKAARSSNVPYLLTPHGAYDPHLLRRKRVLKRLWWTTLERGVVDHAAAIHIFFEEERGHLERLGYAGNVIVAPNGVEIPEADRTETARDYVLWMGRFDVYSKGLDVLLHALASIPAESRPPTRLHGPDWRGGKERMLDLVHTLGLEQSVTIGPPLYGAAKWNALRNARLYVFPSRWEAHGIAAAEAAGIGVPMVATSTSPFGRQLAQGGAALLADPDAGSLASAIVEGWSHDLEAMGQKARELVRDRFSWRAVTDSFLTQLRALS